MTGPRATPRDVYLPNCSRFLFGIDGDLTLSLPHTPIDFSLAAIGGDIESDSGRRAAFVVRRDELLTFTLRFFESEWPSVQAFIDTVQDGVPFVWFPDSMDETIAYDVQLEAPAVGTSYAATPDPNYPVVLLLTITITRGATASISDSGAIIAPVIVYVQGEETEGQIQRVPRDTTGGFLPALRHGDGAGLMEGDVVWHEFGGHDGGGYVTTVANAVDNTSLVDSGIGGMLGQYQLIPLSVQDGGTEEILPKFGGVYRAFNLFGMTLEAPLNVLGIANDSGSGKGFSSVMATIMPDRTIRIRRPEFGTPDTFDGALHIYDVGVPSTEQVPANEWFALELVRGPSVNSTRDASDFGSGFAQLVIYRRTDPATGVLAVDAQRVNTQNSALCGWMWGSEVCHSNSRGITGLGMDDGVCYLRSVSGVRRFIGETFIYRYGTSGPGDTVALGDNPSQIGWDSRRTFQARDHDSGVLQDYNVGYEFTHGNAERWKNVTGKPATPRDFRLHRTTVTICPPFDDCFGASVSYGHTTASTHTWSPGPIIPPHYGNQDQAQTDPPFGEEFDIGEEGTLVRNTFINAREMYRTATDRSGFKSIEGIFSYARLGIRWVTAVIEGGSFVSAPAGIFNLVSEHSVRSPDDDGFGDYLRHDGRVLMKIGTTMIRSPAITLGQAGFGAGNAAAASIFTDQRLAHPLNAYYSGQFLAKNPRTSKAFKPIELNSVQMGFASDFDQFDAHVKQFDLTVVEGSRWSMLDLFEVGFEVAAHKRSVLQREHAPFPPIAILGIYDTTLRPAQSTNLVRGKLVVFDLSTDWDNDIFETTIDYGDGSHTEILRRFPPGSISVDVLLQVHNYAHPGTYHVVVTTEDKTGLANVQTTPIVVPTPQPTALFNPVTDSGDGSGLTIDFIDLSSTPMSVFGTNEIISWHYDFGDGHGSNLQSPTHAYAIAGTYTVVQTVVNDLGATDSISFELVVPIPTGDAACNEFTGTPPLFVQGDDFNGTNFPYIAYPDKDAFETYYYGDIYTEYYDDAFGWDTDFDLDFVNTFNGNPTLVMYFGAPIDVVHTSRSVGAGWFSIPTDDGYPDEQYYDASPFGPRTCWMRSRFKAEAGVMSDVTVSHDDNGSGLEIMACVPRRAYMEIMNRGGKIVLDTNTNNGVMNVDTVWDVCDEAVAGIGRGDALFGEVGLFYEWDETRVMPNGNGAIRIRVWAGTACDMAGAECLLDTGWLEDHRQNEVDYLERYNWFFWPANATPKKLWHATGSQWFDFSAADNPYGYTVGA